MIRHAISPRFAINILSNNGFLDVDDDIDVDVANVRDDDVYTNGVDINRDDVR